MEPGEAHRELMAAAIERDAEGQRALIAGDARAARLAFTAAAELYRQSWEAAPPGGYGRLVGMMKSAILAGGGEKQAGYVRSALTDAEEGSPTASYARAIASLVSGDDATARRAAAAMRVGSDAFARAADAIAALCDGDEDAYRASLRAIVRDFANRDNHLTGVPIADTGVMLQR